MSSPAVEISNPAGHVAELALVRTAVLPGTTYETVVDSLLISPSPGRVVGAPGPYFYTALDLGSPNIDEAITAFANSSGAYDETRYFRQRAVSLSLVVLDNWFPTEYDTSAWNASWNTSSFWVRELGKWVAPAARSHLYVRYQGGGAALYRLDLRGAGLTQGIALTDRGFRNVQLNFVCASGLMREFNEGPLATVDGRTVVQVGFGGTDAGTIGMPITADGNGNLIDFPGLASGTGSSFTYDGTVPTGCIARVHARGGDVTNPQVTFSSDTGPTQSVTLINPGAGSGAIITDGDYLEINTENFTINLVQRQSYPNPPLITPQEQYLTGALRYPQLQLGKNSVSFNVTGGAGTPSGTPYVEVLYYPAFI